MKQTLFEIPFYKFNIINWQDKKKNIIKTLSKFPETRKKLQNFETNRQILRPNLISNIVNILKDDLQNLSQILKKSIAIEDVWSVSYKKGDYQGVHNHGSKGLQAILYLETNIESPKTFFVQPWNDCHSDTTIYRPIESKEGTLIVLPKSILHFTEPNKSKKIKRIVAFDMRTN